MCQVCQKNDPAANTGESVDKISAISSLQELNELIECLNARAAADLKFIEQLIWVVVVLTVAVTIVAIFV